MAPFQQASALGKHSLCEDLNEDAKNILLLLKVKKHVSLFYLVMEVASLYLLLLFPQYFFSVFFQVLVEC